ncbi:hypothetical protein FJZ39_03050 [Candidatus Saccharibacteria bacterium]|nr:hypothetical protein [Candidatus Saccharibacteria bacterium]
MIELLRSRSGGKRPAYAEILYYGLNILLAVAVLSIVIISGSPLLALVLVIASKWRVLAVRPRYWSANIQSNLVDIIVSISLVMLIFAAASELWMQLLLGLLYVGWLVGVKPRSTNGWIYIQACTAILFGTIALYTFTYQMPVFVTVFGMWLIGYASARHIMGSNHEGHITFFALSWGLIMAQLGWITYHWAFAYSLPITQNILLPQASLLALGFSFVAGYIYLQFVRDGKLTASEVVVPSLTIGALMAVLLVFFNSPTI